MEYRQKIKPKSMETADSDFGLLPPQAVDFEEYALGAIMLESDALAKAEDILGPECFYSAEHRLIYSAIISLAGANKPIDMFTVTEQLRKDGKLEEAGGRYKITELTSKVYSDKSIEYYSLVLLEKSMLRKYIATAVQLQQMCYDSTADLADIIDFAEREVMQISQNTAGISSFDMQAAVSSTLNYFAEIQQKKHRKTATGLAELDRAINGGWKNGHLIVAGGRPSMGKTQMAIHFAKSAAQRGNRVLFVSLEMTAEQLVTRMLLENEAINQYYLETGQIDSNEWWELEKQGAMISKLPITISDNVYDLNGIKSFARSEKRKNGLDMIIIDYLQLIETAGKYQTRDIEVGYITRNLKFLAKELDVPVILLAQLNRPQKNTPVKEPHLEDLRESGNIEQDADIVLFPHRPIYYNREAIDSDGNSWEQRGYLIIAKQREGMRNEKIMFAHDRNFKKIFDYLKPASSIEYRNYYEPDNENEKPF